MTTNPFPRDEQDIAGGAEQTTGGVFSMLVGGATIEEVNAAVRAGYDQFVRTANQHQALYDEAA